MVAIAEIPSSPDGASAEACASCNPNGHCGNGLEKVYPTCAVRYGYMNFIGEFKYAPGMLFGCGQKVVVQTDRGTEIGQQVSLTCSGCSKSVSRDQIKTYLNNSGPEFMRLHAGRILRAATPVDLTENEKQQQLSEEMLREGREVVARHALDMKLVTCEYLFGGERAVYYFMSDQRVDFRELVRDLAHAYHTRVEMRQVGARDEARLVADYEICGRECCCKNFLKNLRQVSMRMAKLQKATLDPSKVSGRCGRLRCCLRYEHENYEELNRKLPRNGRQVQTPEGVGTVIDRQILTQLLLVQFPDGRQITFPIEDLTGLDGAGDTAPRAAANEADATTADDGAANFETNAQATPEPPATPRAEDARGEQGRGRRRRRRRGRGPRENRGPADGGQA